MTEKKPVDKSPPQDAAARQAAKDAQRAKALKANLRRRKAQPSADPDAS